MVSKSEIWIRFEENPKHVWISSLATRLAVISLLGTTSVKPPQHRESVEDRDAAILILTTDCPPVIFCVRYSGIESKGVKK